MVGGRAPKQDWEGMLSQKRSLGGRVFWLLFFFFLFCLSGFRAFDLDPGKTEINLEEQIGRA